MSGFMDRVKGRLGSLRGKTGRDEQVKGASDQPGNRVRDAVPDTPSGRAPTQAPGSPSPTQRPGGTTPTQ